MLSFITTLFTKASTSPTFIVGVVAFCVLGFQQYRIHEAKSQYLKEKEAHLSTQVQNTNLTLKLGTAYTDLEDANRNYHQAVKYAQGLKIYIDEYIEGATKSKLLLERQLKDCISQKPPVPVKVGERKSNVNEVWGVGYEDSEKFKGSIRGIVRD